MAFTDNREPAIYISVEDRSYVNAVTEAGRTVVGVFLSPKGRHRQVIDITGGTEQLHNEFGTPNITNTNIA